MRRFIGEFLVLLCWFLVDLRSWEFRDNGCCWIEFDTMGTELS